MNEKRIPFPEKALHEWDYEKNAGLRPEDFSGGSDQKIWWKCELGHSWLTAIKYRTIGTNCPYCAGKKVWEGFNDLLTTHPYIAREWHLEKNRDLRPSSVTAASNKKVWWTCPIGHDWMAPVNQRKRGGGCPYCAGKRVWYGFNDLVTAQPQLALEWDYEKNGALRPEQFTAGSKEKVWWKCENGHHWQAAIYSRKIHGCPYCYGKNTFVPGVNDLLTVNPSLASEWDYEKNVGLRPEHVAVNTSIKVWWRCAKGHSWQAQVSNRNHGNGCPYCSNRIALAEYNDLATVAPELCLEWDYERNAPLKPENVTLGTSRPVWWRCAKGHSWKTMVVTRRNGTGCPVCAGRVVIAGDNDLKTLRPDIAAEWDDEKNGDLLPEHVTVQSAAKVWWRCKRGHSFITQVYNRYNGNDCPYCAGNFPIPGETDFATIHPELLKEWDYAKNGNRTPDKYTSRSNKKVWWICEKGHSWRAVIDDRHLGSRCPYCSGRLAIPGVNDAATLYPKLLDEWDATRNQGLSLQNLLPNSSKKVWWKCIRGHHWRTSVQARIYGTGCPFCKGKTPIRTRLVK